MNTYDPSDRILYVHMSGPADARSAPPDSATAGTVLPSGYASQSPRTRLPRRPTHVRRDRATVASRTVWEHGFGGLVGPRSGLGSRAVLAEPRPAATGGGGPTVSPLPSRSASPRFSRRRVRHTAAWISTGRPSAWSRSSHSPTVRPHSPRVRAGSPRSVHAASAIRSRSVPRLPGDAAYQPLGTRPFCIGGSGDVRRTPALAEGE
jgi:hypothetical protein